MSPGVIKRLSNTMASDPLGCWQPRWSRAPAPRALCSLRLGLQQMGSPPPSCGYASSPLSNTWFQSHPWAESCDLGIHWDALLVTVEKEVNEVNLLTLCSLGIVGAKQNLFMLAIIAAWKEGMDALKP